MLLQNNAEKRMSWQEFFDYPFIKCNENTYKAFYEDNKKMIG